MLKNGRLKILMSPNVKILMGQSLGSWTHGHGPMALSMWDSDVAVALPPNSFQLQGSGGFSRDQ